MQADISNQRFGVGDVNIVRDLRTMLESGNSYIHSFMAIDKQLQSGSLAKAVSLELLADHLAQRLNSRG